MENIITPEFQEFKKIPRLSRDIIITEKLDGTNGVIYIGEAIRVERPAHNGSMLY